MTAVIWGVTARRAFSTAVAAQAKHGGGGGGGGGISKFLRRPLLAVLAAGGGYRYYVYQQGDNDKKKVLIVPFHRLNIKDQQEDGISSFVSDPNDEMVHIELKELVDAIHSAASDPDIVALHGIFGHGSNLKAGWADLEEIRGALKVFKESHRIHLEPNIAHDQQFTVKLSGVKPMLAYADSLGSIMEPGNKEYYLASIFSHIALREKGDLNLFGLLSNTMFLRDLLLKYKIKVHVFQTGDYKNMGNTFTENKLTRGHRENVTRILQGLNENIQEEITESRLKALFAAGFEKGSEYDQLWNHVKQTRALTAPAAKELGLIDSCVARDPIMDLLDKDKEQDPDEKRRFKGERAISLEDYVLNLRHKKRRADRIKKMKALVDRTFSQIGVSIPGITPSTKAAKDKIALLYVGGVIVDGTGRKMVNAIREIRQDKDIKCVVLRVNSRGGVPTACESIVEELKALNLPVVVSMGNVAASGGYYISANADRIFASHKTVTGSIGAVSVRPDLTGFAASYGLKFDSVASSDLSGMNNVFQPMTRKMKKVYASILDRMYAQFKGVVSEGRKIPMEELHKIAEGRVFTGEQAKAIELVDEIGGLTRAIGYAQRNYTGSSESEIVVWPKKKTLMDKLLDTRPKGVPLLYDQLYATPGMDNGPIGQILKAGIASSMVRPGVYYVTDEGTALSQTFGALGPAGAVDDDDFIWG